MGDAISLLGDAISLMGDAISLLGDAISLMGDATALVVEAVYTKEMDSLEPFMAFKQKFLPLSNRIFNFDL